MEDTKGNEIADLRQSKNYADYMSQIGWEVCDLEGINIFIRKLGMLGALAKIQRPQVEINMDRLNELVKSKKIFMCKLEPGVTYKTEAISKFRRDNWPLLGTKTLKIDISGSEERILNSFKKDARSTVRKLVGAKHGVQINNFDNFYNIWQRAAKIKNLWIPSKEEYTKLIKSFEENKCFCVCIDDLSGTLILIHNEIAYYYYSGTLPEGKKNNLPYLTVWEAIKEARRRKCKIWDFEGIYDTRWPNKGWRGFSHFKKSFGGVEVDFPGSWVWWRWPY